MEAYGSLTSHPGISNMGKKEKLSQFLEIELALDLKSSFQKYEFKMLRL